MLILFHTIHSWLKNIPKENGTEECSKNIDQSNQSRQNGSFSPQGNLNFSNFSNTGVYSIKLLINITEPSNGDPIMMEAYDSGKFSIKDNSEFLYHVFSVLVMEINNKQNIAHSVKVLLIVMTHLHKHFQPRIFIS